MVEKDDPSVQIRVSVLGELLLERKRSDGTWESVSLSSPLWGKGTYGTNTRRLLGYLLFCDRRQSFRFAIKEALWPHHPLSTNEYLTRATTSLCDLLRDGSYLQLSANRERYALADQSHIWVDAEHCEDRLSDAQRVGDATDGGIALLEEVQSLFRRGRFLEEEPGQWVHGRRAELQTLAHKSLLRLAHAYETRRQWESAQRIAERLLYENPLDQSGLRHLMLSLHQQGDTSEALKRYEMTSSLLLQAGQCCSVKTEALAERLREKPRTLTIPLEESPPSGGIQSEDIMGPEGGPMNKGRRDVTIALAAIPMVLPAIEQQDLITGVQRVLRQSSLVPGDRELKLLEQKIMLYWQARASVTLVPADMVSHVEVYVQEVWTLLHHSLLPDIRTRLCACLSQGMLLIGASFFSMGQFQTARVYYQAAIDAAHEANNNFLQALIWYQNSFSWLRSNEASWDKHALDSMLKASGFASLESDRAVQCSTDAALAEVYAFTNNRDGCIQAIKRASRLGGCGLGDWGFIHHFDLSKLYGYQGVSLQQFYRPDDLDTHSLIEDARQALEEALSQPNVVTRQRARLVVDMAQVHARKGEVESACKHARQIMDVATIDATVLKRLLTVRGLLEPYADAEEVKELDGHMRTLQLQ